ncbi:hypothetical protein LTR28_010853, partial [Elasticomyces elasticus]
DRSMGIGGLWGHRLRWERRGIVGEELKEERREKEKEKEKEGTNRLAYSRTHRVLFTTE